MTSMIRTIVPIDISVSKFSVARSPHKNKFLVEQKFHYALLAASIWVVIALALASAYVVLIDGLE
jgi:hypothetical protein